MAFPKHCVSIDTARLGEGADSSNSMTEPPRQTPNGGSVDPAKGRHRQRRPQRHATPSDGAKAHGIRMAQGGKGWRKKGQPGAGAASPPKIGTAMGRTGDEPGAPPHCARPTPPAQMDARSQGRRQSHIPGNHKNQTAGPTDPGDVASQRAPGRLIVMAQDNPGKAYRQARNRFSRIGQADRVGEQPKRRKLGSRPVRRVRPCEQAPIHRAADACVLTNCRS